MTFGEYMQENKPGINYKNGCPDKYGLEKDVGMECPASTCKECWNREMPKRVTHKKDGEK